jgi:hypothetical protein
VLSSQAHLASASLLNYWSVCSSPPIRQHTSIRLNRFVWTVSTLEVELPTEGENRAQADRGSTGRSSWGRSSNIPSDLLPRRLQTHFGIHVNKKHLTQPFQPLTCGQLIAHYVEREMSEGNRTKAYSTKAAYKCYLDNWILLRWRSYRLSAVKTVAVEDWLSSLSLAAATKAKLGHIISALFNHAIHYEWLDKNPISLVRQGAKREHSRSATR